MRQLEEGKKLFAKYRYKIPIDSTTVLCEGVSFEQRRDKAIQVYAKDADPESVIAIIDDSVFESGSSGALFCDYKFYYNDFGRKSRKIWYDVINRIYVRESIGKGIKKEQSIDITLKDGSYYSWYFGSVRMQPVVDFVNGMMLLAENPGYVFDAINLSINEDESHPGGEGGGYAASAYQTVNKVYDEEKFHASQGHGFSAERANHYSDKMRGKETKIVGDDNAKDGPDRIVDGVFIQSKYCATGKGCIDACFDNDGNFRYIGKNGKPMVIEVPNDQGIYDAAVKSMKEKIQSGQIPGVTNPDDATKYVKRGTVTYKQALNISRAGNIDSLIYDAQHGLVISTSAFGVSAVVTFATSLWNDDNIDVALKKATFSGLKVGGTAFLTSVLASQLAKAGLNSSLVGSSEAIINLLGPKAAAVLINAFRNGANIYGAAAMKSAAKLLRNNAITGVVTFTLLSLGDVVKIFRGRISGAQLFKDLTNTGATILGGTGGWLAGSTIGSLIIPGVGTVVGGLIGSVVLGAGTGKASDAVLGKFIQDDAEKMVTIIEETFQRLAEEYMLNKNEAEKIVDELSKHLGGKKLEEMFSSPNRETFAEGLLIPLVEKQVKKRPHIQLPDDGMMRNVLQEVLEEIADASGIQPLAV